VGRSKEAQTILLGRQGAALGGACSLANLLICLGHCAPCALRFIPLAAFLGVFLTNDLS